MQTILRVVCDNKGLAPMIDNYLARFISKAESEASSTEVISSEDDNIVFVRDDSDEPREDYAEEQRAQLGSFDLWPNQAQSKLQLIYMNPIILLYRPDGQNLRLWVAGTSLGAAENSGVE